MSKLKKNTETQEPSEWVGCRECDVIFPCYHGRDKCIRLPSELRKSQPKFTSCGKNGAKPEQESPWIRVVDESMVLYHIGVANTSDDYETAKRKLNALLCVAQQIGEDIAKQALSKPKQEPVAWLDEEINCAYTPEELDGGTANGLTPLYTAPTPREASSDSTKPTTFKPLTDEEIDAVYIGCKYGSINEFARSIERAHGIGEQA